MPPEEAGPMPACGPGAEARAPRRPRSAGSSKLRAAELRALLAKADDAAAVATATAAARALPPELLAVAEEQLRGLPASAAVLLIADSVTRRGIGGRQTKPDPQADDPELDPQRAARIRYNRRAAACSKLKRKLEALGQQARCLLASSAKQAASQSGVPAAGATASAAATEALGGDATGPALAALQPGAAGAERSASVSSSATLDVTAAAAAEAEAADAAAEAATAAAAAAAEVGSPALLVPRAPPPLEQPEQQAPVAGMSLACGGMQLLSLEPPAASAHPRPQLATAPSRALSPATSLCSAATGWLTGDLATLPVGANTQQLTTAAAAQRLAGQACQVPVAALRDDACHDTEWLSFFLEQ